MPKKLTPSILNLVPVREGKGAREAFEDMVSLAQHVDQSDYARYWVAEHHNTTSIASSATRQLIQHILHHTENIRVGSGGVMLPNHSPLIVAEEFGTMHAIFGDRLDIGLGRAPGTDMLTAGAIRRNNHDGVYTFGSEVEEIRQYLSDEPTKVTAYPGSGTNIPLYILGSSTDSAHLAARLGLPYAFAAHFAPGQMDEAFKIYEREFEPSDQLDAPYRIACLNVICADTDEAAKYLSTTMSQFVLNVVRGGRNKLQPPVDDMSGLWSPQEKQIVESRFPVALMGSEDTVLEKLRLFQNQYGVDEIMAVSYIYDTDAQKRSYDIFEAVVRKYNGE
ncbi:LLM class flavin-dependent oxidoreductase [Salinicoccus sp. ID82-1]|uniref:LLM class flavin-dependent oxidoreductase n=1 Tax=Salinicoccus sp. ID82-1 TaxID=2820269 RepID=UPI001F1E0D60|nr:LLM class flavin-dependent oxidoreductase [Salinicoccus sp. ID82-1]MCG1008877.1 LLM class flavin-dependent oxidoreductase [Salinicoccus sp. ID82-1]